jgi:hypothetical protein
MMRLTRWIVVLLLAVVSAAAASPAALVVEEAKLGKGVENRMIVDPTTTFDVGDKVYLALKVTGGPSDPVKINWTIGEYTDSFSLAIGGPSWRTWAYKNAFKSGAWSVTVTDSTGATLKDLAFTVK